MFLGRIEIRQVVFVLQNHWASMQMVFQWSEIEMGEFWYMKFIDRTKIDQIQTN